MTEVSAVKTALGLLHLPASLRRLQSAPLPPDVETLLRIAAGDEDELSRAAVRTERPPAVIRDAAVFYIEQVLLNSDSDSYRVLGAAPDASAQDLRHNMALLMSWLHPDKDLAGDRAVLAARVTRAWNNLRSPDRRMAYDATLAAAPPRTQAPKLPRFGQRKNAGAVALPPHHRLSRKHEADLHIVEHNTLLRRGWHFLRRALRAGS